MGSQAFEVYPWRISLIGIGFAALTYALGALVLSGFGAVASILYLAYCAFVEILVLRSSCAHCYYYGKACGFGRGRLCALFFKGSDPKRFLERPVSLRDILPDILVSAIPIIAGVILLMRQFDWFVLTAILVMLLLASAGNAYVRSSLVCRYCAQRELGCPAEKLFNKGRA